MRRFSLLLLICLLPACQGWVQVEIEKPAGTSESDTVYEVAGIKAFKGLKQFRLDVIYPESQRNKRLKFVVSVRSADPDGKTLEIQLPTALGLEITAAEYTGQLARIVLGDEADVQALQEPPYRGPRDRQYSFADLFPSIGVMNRTTNSTLWGLIPLEYAHCTGFVIGPSLVMTNHHCIENQAQCEAASFQFWDSRENNFLGLTKIRGYSCKQLVVTDEALDFSILRMEGDPREHYPSLQWMIAPLRISRGTVVTILSHNPKGQKRSNGCWIEESGKTYRTERAGGTVTQATDLTCADPVILGDSGSPVLNHDGDLVGMVWGSDKNRRINGEMTPLSAIWGHYRSLLESLPIEKVRRPSK